MGALCSSTAQPKESRGAAHPTNQPNPASQSEGNSQSGGGAQQSGAVKRDQGGATVLDITNAHLENNPDDGGALEVYLDDNFQMREGQTAEELNHRRPSMDIPEAYVPSGKIKAEQITLGAMIGSGSFGKVLHGHYKGMHIAVKQIFLPVNEREKAQVFQDFNREVETLKRVVHHPRILRFVGAVSRSTRGQAWILTEIMTGSVATLLKMIKNCGGSHKLSWKLVLQIAIDASDAIAYLHSQTPPIIHRDLKAENLLLDENFRCKLADFGLARVMDAGKTMTICGTPSWIAPEVFAGEHYDTKVDVYSFAILVWELLCAEKPYKGIKAAKIARSVVTQGMRPTIPSFFPPSIKSALPDMWHDTVARRPDMEGVSKIIKQAMTEVDLTAGVPSYKKHF